MLRFLTTHVKEPQPTNTKPKHTRFDPCTRSKCVPTPWVKTESQKDNTETGLQELRYLSSVPPTGRVWHKAFLGGSWCRAIAHTRPAAPKMPQAPGDKPNPSDEGKAWGDGPLRLEVCQEMWHTRPDPCRRRQSRLKCVPSTGFSWLMTWNFFLSFFDLGQESEISRLRSPRSG